MSNVAEKRIWIAYAMWVQEDEPMALAALFEDAPPPGWEDTLPTPLGIEGVKYLTRPITLFPTTAAFADAGSSFQGLITRAFFERLTAGAAVILDEFELKIEKAEAEVEH